MENQKLILVYYIDIMDLPNENVQSVMNNIAKTMAEDSKEYKNFFIPVRGDGTMSRIECINPVKIEANPNSIR